MARDVAWVRARRRHPQHAQQGEGSDRQVAPLTKHAVRDARYRGHACQGNLADARVTSVPRALTVAAWAFAAFSLTWPSPVSAHAYLIRSSPSARATVVRAPERVQLWFNERLEPAYSRVSVWNGDAQRVDTGDVRIAPDEPTLLSVGVPPLPAGSYTVKYRVLSVDGHLVESEFVFRVRAP